VLVLGVNSAIAACYYLKLAFAPLTEAADDADGDPILAAPFRTRAAAAVISCLCVIGLAIGGNVLMQGARTAAAYTDAAALKSRMPQAAAPAEADRGVAAQ
jgi:NADH:ubiquinone oxidoreductase subunit 2 (subunit N)